MIPSTTTSRVWLRRASTTALFTVLTAIMTWPQALTIGTHAVSHHDVLFNLWRLRWIAHALTTSPGRLFDGNMFYPEQLVLTMSDAMILEGILAAPLFWLGLPPVLVHNLLLLGAIIASGVGMFVLAEHLSSSRMGAAAAGIVFAFAPYRFEHYMHMELQWAVWLPWAFWALQRTIETGKVTFGVVTGVFVALQMFSSIYYGVFLSILLPIVAILQLIPLEKRRAFNILQRLAIGAVTAASASALYATPYARTSARVEERTSTEVTTYSAKPKDYLTATGSNLLYGDRSRGLPERRLFPGFVAPLLGLIGVLLVTPRPATVAYLIGGVVAFELSLGMYGVLYPLLYDHVSALHALRAPARASIFCLLFLGVLAAQGCAALTPVGKPRLRQALAVAVVGGLLAEYWVAPLGLVPFPNRPPALYQWLAQQPDGVVAHVPMPTTSSLPGPDPVYAYMSTFHWKPLLNGYSGYYPRAYLQRLDAFEGFPDSRAIARLRDSDVTYLVVHGDAYAPADLPQIFHVLVESGLLHLGHFDDGTGRAAVFRVR